MTAKYLTGDADVHSGSAYVAGKGIDISQLQRCRGIGSDVTNGEHMKARQS